MNSQLRFNQQISIGIRLALIMFILCGVFYSGFMTKLSALLFPLQAHGSLLMVQGKPVGSELIAQPFVSEKYFYGRPSAAAYDPTVASGSNLAVSNPVLRARVEINSQAIQKSENVEAKNIPVDLVSASGSGLDPHISPASAFLQVARVAKARGLMEEAVRAVVDKNIEGPQWKIFGQPRVNVLKLNVALDGMK